MELGQRIVQEIINYKRNYKFSEQKELVTNAFVENISRIYEENPNMFDEASFRLLLDSSWYDCEETQVLMEIADMFSYTDMDVELFRLRFFLGISRDEDMLLMQQKLINAFSVCGIENEVRHQLPYIWLAEKIHGTAYERILKNTVLQAGADAVFADFGAVTAYVSMMDSLGWKKDVPRCWMTLYDAEILLYSLLNDGLLLWLNNRGKRSGIRDMKRAISVSKAIGLESVAHIIAGAIDIVHFEADGTLSAYSVEQLNLVEEELYAELDGERLSAALRKFWETNQEFA